MGGKREYGPFLIDRAADERTPLFPHSLSHSFPKLAHSTINHGGKEKGSFRKRLKNFFVSSPPSLLTGTDRNPLRFDKKVLLFSPRCMEFFYFQKWGKSS